MTGAPSARGARVGRRIGRVLAPSVYAVQRVGAELVPREGPLIVAANHSGFIDGPLVVSMFPRPVHFLAKRGYFDSPFGPLLRAAGQIPIEQRTGDRAALAQARAVLAGGGVVGIFPEGTRGTGRVAAAQQGAAYLAMQASAPIVPLACLGTRAVGRSRDSLPRPRSRVAVVIGAPFQVQDDAGGNGRDRLRRATELLREHLAAHVERAVEQTRLTLPTDAPPPSRIS